MPSCSSNSYNFASFRRDVHYPIMAYSRAFHSITFALLVSHLSFVLAAPAPISTSTPSPPPSGTTDKKVIYYHQSLMGIGNQVLSLQPLINNQPVAVTNLIIGTLHLNTTDLVLNDDPLTSPIFDGLWSDVDSLRSHNMKVHALLQTNFSDLAGSSPAFESTYGILRDGIKSVGKFDGIDLDIEDAQTPNPIGLQDVINLIDRLRQDFGSDFLITMSPVASALSGGSSLSAFDYKALDQQRGQDIAWYNAQFYNGFGDASTPDAYNSIIQNGFAAGRVVMGLASSVASVQSGFVPLDTVQGTLQSLTAAHPDFAGVAAWEYFDSEPGGQAAPWQWSQKMAGFLSGTNSTASNTRRHLQDMLFSSGQL